MIKDDNLSELSVSHPGQKLRSMWDCLSVLDNRLIIVDCSRIFVPHKAREVLIAKGHRSHCGAAKMKAHFRQLYYWPGMANEIENAVRGCEQCYYHLPSHPKEPLQPMTASRLMQRLGVGHI